MTPEPKPRGRGARVAAGLLLIGSIVASITGFVVFFLLFIPDFNIYWMILAPVILACYQIPAVVLFGLHKRFKRRAGGEAEPEAEDRSDSTEKG